MGISQLSFMLGVPKEELETEACGINHFTWLQKIKHKPTGQDLYPKLKEIVSTAAWFANRHEIRVSRILYHRFGLDPSGPLDDGGLRECLEPLTSGTALDGFAEGMGLPGVDR